MIKPRLRDKKTTGNVAMQYTIFIKIPEDNTVPIQWQHLKILARANKSYGQHQFPTFGTWDSQNEWRDFKYQADINQTWHNTYRLAYGFPANTQRNVDYIVCLLGLYSEQVLCYSSIIRYQTAF